MSACSNQNEVSTAPKRQGGDHVDQSFHLADGIRLTMAPTVNSLFSTADDLFQIHHDNTCRRVSVKFLDENKREIEREENLDLREALETEVVTVLNTFVAEQDKRDADILSCNYERAMRVWSMHQQQRRDRALRRKKQITSNDVLSPVSPLILSMAPLDIVEGPRSSLSAADVPVEAEFAGEGRKPAGFKVKANQTSKSTPLQRLWKAPPPKNKIKMTLNLDKDVRDWLQMSETGEWISSTADASPSDKAAVVDRAAIDVAASVKDNSVSNNSLASLDANAMEVNAAPIVLESPSPSFLSEVISEFSVPPPVPPPAATVTSVATEVDHSALDSSLSNTKKKPSSSSLTAASAATTADSVRVPVLAVPFVPSLPLSFTWISIAANVRTDDDTVLRSLPYFGDEDVTGVDMSDFDKIPAEYEAPASGEAEEFTIVYMLDKYRRSSGFIRPEVYSALSITLGITVSEVSKAYERVSEGPYYLLTVKEKNNPNFQMKTLNPKQVDDDKPLLMLYGMEPSSVSVESAGNGVGLGIYNSSDYTKVIENYRALFCRRCYTYNCNNHPINQPLPTIRVDPSPPFACPFPGLELPTDFIRNEKKPGRSLSQIASESSAAPGALCSDPLASLSGAGSQPLKKSKQQVAHKKQLCTNDLELQKFLYSRKPLPPSVVESVPLKMYAGLLKNEAGEKGSGVPLTDVEKTLITKLYSIYGAGIARSVSSTSSTSSSSVCSGSDPDEDKRAAALKTIARLLGTRSVEEIDEYVQSASLPLEDVQRNMTPKKPVKVSVHDKNKTIREFVPCSHEGPCSKANCWCVQNGSFCEKYCCCGVDCKHKFPGCNCHSGCTSKACPCVAANRSCDPDLCGVCGASVPAALVPRVEAHFDAVRSGSIKVPGLEPHDCKLCVNSVFLHKRSGKRLLMAPSEIHGWGAYIEKSAERHEFITEYLGEIISQDEADRRGKVYDKINQSYLFTMNEDQAVDASRKGNKAKFLNHSTTPNCYTRIVQVNGDHRIGMYADRRIAAGEELSFDYGYLEEIAPIWSKRRRTNQGESSLGGSNSKHQKS